MSTHNEINGPVHGHVIQAGTLHLGDLPRHRASIALYYPYIHVRDDTWLKYAALYWPAITRLVPPDYRPADSPVASAFVRAGMLSDLDPAIHSRGDVFGFLEMVSERADELRARFGLQHLDEWPEQDRFQAAGENPDPRLAYLHVTKLPDDLVNSIVDNGLGVLPPHGCSGQWIGMHPDLAAVYMCELVSRLARHESLQPITDQELPHTAFLERNVDRIADVLLGMARRRWPRWRRDPVPRFMTAAVQTVVPAGLADVPVEKILELRETFPGDFHRFRAHVGDRFTELKADATADLHISVAVDELVRAELADLEDKLRSIELAPRRVRVQLKSDAVRESPVGWLLRAGQALA